ncbi:thioredoxin domain-containing protein [Brevundimonas sp.]|uniref:thioredoxin domain-containing protein n=1 Tax=Brevundimonas sp. TaxID=1871086 RepID=UPI002CF10647|nr:thioredoxin domain-containing protein [Brevundimonas sp.]HWQ86930.1 thioredoxin domain-containing protein [Brevundimonas sp.]
MKTALSRRAAVTAVTLTAVIALAGCGSKAGAPAEGDMALGAPEGAEVTVVEYASVTCHICAAWQDENWAGFKAKWIDTNKVRYVFREIPTPPANVAVAGFAIARCAGEDKYFDVVHGLMSSQGEWQAGANPRDTLFRVGNGVGLSNDRITACITDEAALKAADERARAAVAAGVDGTPTFFVNGVKVLTPGSPSGTSLADLSSAIEAELAKP